MNSAFARPRNWVMMAGVASSKRPGVADQREVGGQFLRVLLQEGNERGRAGFLFALEEDRQLAGQGAVDGFPGAAGLEEGHQLALVVGGAAGADDGAFGRVLDRGVEGRAVPERQRIDGLHVIVAVEEEVAAPVPSPWATTIGWPGVGRARR